MKLRTPTNKRETIFEFEYRLKQEVKELLKKLKETTL